MQRSVKWTIATVYLGFIAFTVYAANQRSLPTGITNFLFATPGIDKVCHFVLVGGLAVTINWLLNCRDIRIARLEIQLGTVICLIVATLEEISQAWNPNRTADIIDFSMNTLGILLLGPLARKLPQPRPV